MFGKKAHLIRSLQGQLYRTQQHLAKRINRTMQLREFLAKRTDALFEERRKNDFNQREIAELRVIFDKLREENNSLRDKKTELEKTVSDLATTISKQKQAINEALAGPLELAMVVLDHLQARG